MPASVVPDGYGKAKDVTADVLDENRPIVSYTVTVDSKAGVKDQITHGSVLIAAITNSQLAAMLAALGGTMLPNTMLSGLIFPVTSMPLPLQLLTNIVPARWFIEIVRGIMLKGVGLSVLWPQLLILSVMLAVLLTLAIRRTNVRLA